MTEKEYKEFKKLFWVWFDSLPSSKKNEFWYYKEDVSETHFYFKHYEGRLNAH